MTWFDEGEAMREAVSRVAIDSSRSGDASDGRPEPGRDASLPPNGDTQVPYLSRAAERERIAAMPDKRPPSDSAREADSPRESDGDPRARSDDDRRADWDALPGAVAEDRATNPRRLFGSASVAEHPPDAGPQTDDSGGRPVRPTDEGETKSAEQTKINEPAEPDADDLPDALRSARDHPEDYAGKRAAELQGQVPESSRGWITMGVGVGTDGEGGTRIVVGTSEARGYLREGVTLRPGEERSREPGHAEISILKHMADRDIVPSHVAAGRPICSPCADSIDSSGASPASPLKHPREDTDR